MTRLKRIAENLFRDKITKTYYLIVRRMGKQIKESLATRDYTLAKQKLKDRLEELLPDAPTDAADLTWLQVRERYEKIELVQRKLKSGSFEDRLTNLNAIEKVWPQIKRMKVRDITEKACKDWKAQRVQTGISAQRLNNELGTLKQILDLAVEERAILRNPAERLERVKIPKRKPVFPEQEEFKRIVQNLRHRRLDDAADVVEMLGYSGMRLEEAANLLWRDVDGRRKLVFVRGLQEGTQDDEPKNLEQRAIPLFRPLAHLLTRIAERTGDIKPDEKVLLQPQCRRALQTACRQIGVRR